MRKALGTGPADDNPQILYEIGECLEAEGSLTEAQAEYLKIPELYPESTFWAIRADLSAAKILERLGRTKDALGLYEKLAALDVEESKYAKERIGIIKDKTSNTRL